MKSKSKRSNNDHATLEELIKRIEKIERELAKMKAVLPSVGPEIIKEENGIVLARMPPPTGEYVIIDKSGVMHPYRKLSYAEKVFKNLIKKM